MKKILFFTVLVVLLASHTAKTQCTVSDVAIELKSTVEVGGQCQVVFDLSWNQDVNNGNKFAYLHLWTSSQYPNLLANGLAYTPTSNFPDATDLINALATIVIDSNGTLIPHIGTVYYPDPTVIPLTTGLSVIQEVVGDSIERMTIRNISLTIPVCTGVTIIGDIWASQAENGHNVHCVSSGVSVVIGNPRVSGFLFCDLPRKYNVQIRNVDTVSITVSYDIFIDEGDAVYEPLEHDFLITDTIGPIVLAPGEIYNSGPQTYLPYSNQKPYSDNGLWVEVSTVGYPNKTIAFIANTCIPLPVVFGSFTARRTNEIVNLTWETNSEIDCRGFEIQRRTGNEAFKAIATVPSRAIGGNSQALLRYTYGDLNRQQGISEYRIREIDLNERSFYSEIRMVRGPGQKNGVIVAPNPSHNGQVNVLFEARGIQDMRLYDATGRLVRQWPSIATGSLLIEKLHPGFYTIQLIDRQTGDKTTEKFIIAAY